MTSQPVPGAMDRTKVGLALVGVAALLWLVMLALQGGGDAVPTLGLVLVAVGGLVAGFASRPALRAGALAVVAVGILVFYEGAIFVDGTASVAGGLFAVGAAVAAFGFARGERRAVLVGAAVAALGSALWIYTDLGSPEWQPGNVLATVAWVVVAADSR